MTYRDEGESLRARVEELEAKLEAAEAAAATQRTAHQLELAYLRRQAPPSEPAPAPRRSVWVVPVIMTLVATLAVGYYAHLRTESPPTPVLPI